MVISAEASFLGKGCNYGYFGNDKGDLQKDNSSSFIHLANVVVNSFCDSPYFA